MHQLSYNDVQKLSYEQLAAIDDPMALMATGQVSPILLRYVVRTEQLQGRYGEVPLPILMDAIGRAAAIQGDWPFAVGQKAPQAVRDKDVDDYLDRLDALGPLKILKEQQVGR